MRTQALIAGTVLAFLTSCSTVEVEGRVRQGYTRKLERVCIVVTSMRELDQPFFTALKGSLEQGFKARGIQSCVRLGPVEPEIARHWFTQMPEGPTPPPPPLPDMDPASLEKSAGFTPAFLLVVRPTSRGVQDSVNHTFSPGVGVGPKASPGEWSTSTSSMQKHMLLCALSEAPGGLMVWKGEIEMQWAGGQRMYPGPGPEVLTGFGPRKERPIQVDPKEFTQRLMEQLQVDGLLDKAR